VYEIIKLVLSRKIRRIFLEINVRYFKEGLHLGRDIENTEVWVKGTIIFYLVHFSALSD
jgi:hypothetical protein